MPLVSKGPLEGFYFPDYEGGTVVHLMASIIRALGGESPHGDLEGLGSAQLAGARKIINLIVDGLGVKQLERHVRSGRGTAFLAARPYRAISTVFPATTAAAITTLTTGASPAEHGILGWHLNLHDLGMVSTILPATTRMGMPLAGERFALREYLSMPSYVESVKCRTGLISEGDIPRSRYSLAGTRWQERFSFTRLRGLERHVLSFARRRGAGFCHAYWPGYDSHCHDLGCYHPKTLDHLDRVDEALERIARRLKGAGAVLIVTADHGLVDAMPGCFVELREVRGLYDCLPTLPSGDARCMHCFVRPSKVAQFLRIVKSRLSDACACVPGEDLLAGGAFGPGEPHPCLAARVGDFALLARDGYTFAATPRGMETRFNVANHGGMSRAEVLVPLYVVRP